MTFCLYIRAIGPLQHGWLQRNDFFSADLLDLRNAHTAKHTDELGNSCAVPYPSFCKLTVFDHPFSSTCMSYGLKRIEKNSKQNLEKRHK